MDLGAFANYFKTITKQDIKNSRLASSKMAPLNRDMSVPDNASPIKSSVLLLIWMDNEEFFITFIKRTKDRGVHSGQIAFPGGRFDFSAGDKNTLDTAIRETCEEIGCCVSQDKILTSFEPLYVPPSNFIIYPYLALLEKKPKFVKNPCEVDEIINVPVLNLIKDDNIILSEFETVYGVVKAPCFLFNGIKIWGATSIILCDFLCLYKKLLLTDKIKK